MEPPLSPPHLRQLTTSHFPSSSEKDETPIPAGVSLHPHTPTCHPASTSGSDEKPPEGIEPIATCRAQSELATTRNTPMSGSKVEQLPTKFFDNDRKPMVTSAAQPGARNPVTTNADTLIYDTQRHPTTGRAYDYVDSLAPRYEGSQQRAPSWAG
jgi:hypothetical protein